MLVTSKVNDAQGPKILLILRAVAKASSERRPRLEAEEYIHIDVPPKIC
jgi:hypothetical protein